MHAAVMMDLVDDDDPDMLPLDDSIGMSQLFFCNPSVLSLK